jgi:hypothetical protein
VGLAKAARAPTEFRLLNGLGPVTVGAAPAGDAAATAAEGRDTNRLLQVRPCHCSIIPRTGSFTFFKDGRRLKRAPTAARRCAGTSKR